MMDYKKKYNEALERFKAFKEKYYTKNTVIGDVIFDKTGEMQRNFESIFPELRESEDEMIRRTLVEYFGPEVQLDFVRGVPIQKIRDWLEKQKEQNHPDGCFTCDEYKKGYEAGRLNGITAGYNKAMKEQKPTWSEEDERIIKDAIYALEEVGGYPCIVKELKSIRSIKQEWSEEDEKMVKFYEDDCNNCIGNIPMKDVVEMRLKFKNWIANRIKFLRPQSKREWSEEDKKMLADIIVFISGYADKRVVAEWVNFLKSLRPSWKPSEGQIAILWDAISNLKHDGYKHIEELISLYEQLKKL